MYVVIEKLKNGGIRIENERYHFYSMRDALAKWRKDNNMQYKHLIKVLV